ncbi:hypothetical protein MAPG_07627 [Magnaporthiopsis poae ATCC 64411]|uniref:Uncharacterized protein n=1 Tax=Magnaporthiopsis poae (strain ATCC 64411 / 73-15) TaxID=644358 RepID=A0A0C4E563_MAGP6|nr:hypothetical protein MAPG_07627 [Magnaporthiopsis poae ATCC 64411]
MPDPVDDGGAPAGTGGPQAELAHPKRSRRFEECRKEIAEGFIQFEANVPFPVQLPRRVQAPLPTSRTTVDNNAEMAKRPQGIYRGTGPKVSAPFEPAFHNPIPRRPFAPGASTKHSPKHGQSLASEPIVPLVSFTTKTPPLHPRTTVPACPDAPPSAGPHGQSLVSEPMGHTVPITTKTPPLHPRTSTVPTCPDATSSASPHGPRDIVSDAPSRGQQPRNHTQPPSTEKPSGAGQSPDESHNQASTGPDFDMNRLNASFRHHSQEHSARQSLAQTPTPHTSPVPLPGRVGSPAGRSIISSTEDQQRQISERYKHYKDGFRTYRHRCHTLEQKKQKLKSYIDDLESKSSAQEKNVERLESENNKLRKGIRHYRDYVQAAVQEQQSLFVLAQDRYQAAVEDMHKHAQKAEGMTEEVRKKVDEVQTRLMNAVKSVSDQAKIEILEKDLTIKQLREQVQERDADLERERERRHESERVEELANSMQREFTAQVANLMGKLKEDKAGLVEEMQQRNDKDISRLESMLQDMNSKSALGAPQADVLSALVQLASKSFSSVLAELDSASRARTTAQKTNANFASSIQAQLEEFHQHLVERDMLAMELTEVKRANAALATAAEERHDECESLFRDMSRMATEINDNERTLAELSDELIRLRWLQQQSEAEIAALFREVARLLPLQEQSERQKAEISALSDEVALLRAAEREVESLRAEVVEKTKAIAHLKGEVKTREEKAADAAREHLQAQENAASRQRQKVQALEEGLQRAVSAAEDARTELVETRSALEKQLSEADEKRRLAEEVSEKEAAVAAVANARISDLQSQADMQLGETRATLASRERDLAALRLQLEDFRRKEGEKTEELELARDLARELGLEVSTLKDKHQRTSHTIASLETKILECTQQKDSEAKSPCSGGESADLQVLSSWQQWASALTGSLKQWVLRSRKAKRIYRKLQDTPDFKLDLGGDEELEAAKDTTSVFLAIYEYLKEQTDGEKSKTEEHERSELGEIIRDAGSRQVKLRSPLTEETQTSVPPPAPVEHVRQVKLRNPLVEETPTSVPPPISVEQTRRRQNSQPKPILRKRALSQTLEAEPPVVLSLERVTRQKRTINQPC